MVGINQIPESQDYNRENLVDSDAMNRLEEFKKHLDSLSSEEQQKIAKKFDDRVNKYMDPEFKAQLPGTSIESQQESSEVTDSDLDNINKLNELHAAVDGYPNIPEAQKKALHDIIYNPANKAENQVATAIQKDKSDKNIEA